ncbi:MAG: hypothetical protein Q8L49_05815 [Burkholderiaceae bacterium]|nr:hypothetical protein [Burkholderiaceae bacterium]
MPQGDVVADHEEVVRSIFDPLYSTRHGRPASNAFCQLDASVSRTAILSHDEIVKIFQNQRAEGCSPVVMTCTVLVGHVTEVCQAAPSAGIAANVIEDAILHPRPGEIVNPAHAVIRAWSVDNPTVAKELTKGMSKALLRLGRLTPVA